MTCACREPEIRCAECGDTYRRARKPGQRRDLLRDAVIEAAREVMYRQLMVERAGKTVLGVCRQNERDYSMQDLRDALAAERRAR